MAKTELVKVEDYKIITMESEKRREIIAANIGSQSITQFDLDKATFPSGGSTKWEVVGANGPETVDAIVGIIIGHRKIRAYWETSIDEGGGSAPPDCSSNDCLTGMGDPGGDCTQCPLSQFGTAKKGKGQACSLRHVLFVMQPEAILPLAVSLPPASLKASRRYFLHELTANGRAYYEVISEITLERGGGNGVPPHAKAVLRKLADLEGAQREQFKQIAEQFAPFLNQIRADQIMGDEEAGDPVPA